LSVGSTRFAAFVTSLAFGTLIVWAAPVKDKMPAIRKIKSKFLVFILLILSNYYPKKQFSLK